MILYGVSFQQISKTTGFFEYGLVYRDGVVFLSTSRSGADEYLQAMVESRPEAKFEVVEIRPVNTIYYHPCFSEFSLSSNG